MLVIDRILWCFQWAHAKAWAQEMVGCCGPARAYRQVAVYSYYRPMRAFRSAAARQPIYTGWANASRLTKYYGACDLAGCCGPARAQRQGQLIRAHGITSFGNWPTRWSCVADYCSHNGPILVIDRMLWRLQWAHAKAWARETVGCCGPARGHRQGATYPYYRPMRQHLHMMGQC